MEEKKSGKLLIIILILFILILIMGIAYLIFQNMELMKKQKQGESQLQTLQNKTQELENKINTNKSVTEENTIEQTQQNTIQSNTTKNITEESVTQQTQPNNVQNTTTTRKDDPNYVGTYKNSSGEIATISKKADDYYLNFNNNSFKFNMNVKNNDGSIIIYDSKDEFDRWFVYLYPAGVNLKLAENEGDKESSYKATDSSKIRLLLNGSSQEFLSDVLYKID